MNQLQARIDNANAVCASMQKQNDSDFQDMLVATLGRIVTMTRERDSLHEGSALVETFNNLIAKEWRLRDQVKAAIALNNAGPP